MLGVNETNQLIPAGAKISNHVYTVLELRSTCTTNEQRKTEN